VSIYVPILYFSIFFKLLSYSRFFLFLKTIIGILNLIESNIVPSPALAKINFKFEKDLSEKSNFSHPSLISALLLVTVL